MNSKILGVHGFQKYEIKDDRWTIKDKVHQFRGVLKLYERNHEAKAAEAVRERKNVSRELKIINSEVKEYRGLVNEVQYGDKRRMRNILRDHRDLQLAYENRNPGIIYHAINRDCNLRRKQLDELYYVKQNKMKEFFNLKLEATTILNQLDEQNHLRKPNRYKQRTAALYHKLLANKAAAETIRTTYQSMLNILEKDAIQFTSLIDSLRNDRIEQCKVLMATTYVGQLAAEELDDTRQRYKKMSIDILKNIKERKCALDIVHTQVNSLWSNIKMLVRVESETKYMGWQEKTTGVEEDLEKQIKSLEDTFERVKETLLIRSYDGLCSRFEEQAGQRTRLMAKFNASLGERDAFLNKKNCAELILAELNHSMISTTGQYKTEKKEMLEKIEGEKKRELEFIKLRKSRGELLIDIKAALQNMLAIMVCVKPDWSVTKKLGKDKHKRMEAKDNKQQNSVGSSDIDAKLELPTVNTDACIMLEEVAQKAAILLELSNFEITPEDEEKARNLYQNYIADHRTSYYLDRLTSETKLSVDHEVVDPTILTRFDIKSRSKQVVETHSRFD